MGGPAGIKFGNFTLGKRLARGGMAEVFLAHQRGPEGFERRVAVKRILPHLAETHDFVRMFLDEARLAARLSHPNVVHIYELGQVDGDYFIAMEFVDGIHAGQLIGRTDDPLPPVLVARLGADAAGALAYAHRLEDVDGRPLQLVHRDVSPHNIMVSFDGVVKLVDFGIAKAALKADETRPGIVKGKYAYMSPEQTVGRPLDGRSDVFSLGVCLWEILAGKTIVDRGDVVEAMKVIRDGRYLPIEKVAPRTPPALAQALGWALAHKRDDRATAAQLQVALEEFIKGSPQIATAGQLAEWIRPRFPRVATGAPPADDDAGAGSRQRGDATGRPGRRTAPPPAGTSAVRAVPGRASTVPVPVTDAPAALRPGTAVVSITEAPAVAEITVRTAADRPLPSLAAERAPPPPPAERPSLPTAAERPLPPPLPAAVRPRAPTHLDAEIDAIAEGPDAPTRRHQASTIMPVPPRSRLPIAVAIALALGVAIGLAVMIAGGGGERPVAIDAAPGPGDDAAPLVVALPDEPADAGPVDAGPVDAAPALDARAAAPPRPPPRPDRRPVPDGFLTVRTNPYSIVTLGNRQLGETPFAGVPLPAGTHVLTFTNPERGSVKRTVLIRPGQTTKLQFQLP